MDERGGDAECCAVELKTTVFSETASALQELLFRMSRRRYAVTLNSLRLTSCRGNARPKIGRIDPIVLFCKIFYKKNAKVIRKLIECNLHIKFFLREREKKTKRKTASPLFIKLVREGNNDATSVLCLCFFLFLERVIMNNVVISKSILFFSF